MVPRFAITCVALFSSSVPKALILVPDYLCAKVLQTLFNLCRLNKGRQEETAQSGIIPHLRKLVNSRSPLRQFALPYAICLQNSCAQPQLTVPLIQDPV